MNRRFNASSFCLHCLSPADFTAFLGDEGIERHILSLKWGNSKAVLTENAA
jgi:hypothetical protein